jgi:hypothetical protein
MLVPRIAVMLAATAGLFAAAPASAQFFMKSPSLAGERIAGTEPGMTGPALPGATPAELRAAVTWNLRAALNVAALQCQFEPTLLTLDNYNALLKDHGAELNTSLTTVQKYFTRTNKDKKVAQVEFDRYGTRVYSSFSTVSGQLTFCQTAAAIGHDALFVKAGDLSDLAMDRMRELRASLSPWGEQYRRTVGLSLPAPTPLPPFGNDKCWKKGAYQAKKCGALAIASR